MKKSNRRFTAVILAATVALAVLASCAMGGKSESASDGIPYPGQSYNAPSGNYENKTEYPSEGEPYEKVSSTDPAPDEKLVYTGTVTAQTKSDINDVVSGVQGKVAELGGYVSNTSVSQNGGYRGSYPTAQLVCRVPTESFDSFISYLRENLSVTGSSTGVENVTESYYSAKSAYDTYLVQEQRLLQLMSEAKDLKDMLLLEDKLADVRRNIQYYETMLKTYDSKVAYATVTLNLTQVVEYTAPAPYTFGERIKNAFTGSWEGFAEGAKNFAVWFVETLPTLIVLAVIAVAVVLIIRGAIRSSRKKKAKAAELEEQRRLEIVKRYQEEQQKNSGNGQTQS